MSNLYPLSWIIKKMKKVGPQGIHIKDLEICWNREKPDEPFQRRTFDRRCDNIRNSFGIDIDHIGKGYYAITSPDEATELAMWCLSSYQIMDKLNVSPMLRNYILFEEVPHGLDDMDPILDAILNLKIVEFDYSKRYGDAETRKRAPLGLYLYHRIWYLLAMKEDGSKHCYALNRLSNLKVVDEAFVYPKGFSMKKYFENSFGIFRPDDGKPERVVVRYFGNAKNFVPNKPIHHTQKWVEETADSVTFEYKLFVTPDLVDHLVGFGYEAEVLKPDSLRKEMKEISIKTAKRYE